MVQASPTAGLKNRSDGKLIINLNKGLGNKGLHKLSSQTGLNLTGATTTAGVGSGIVDGWIDGGEEGGLKKKEKKRKRLGLLGNTSTAVLGIAEETVGGVGTGAVTGTAPTATILATPVLLPGLPGPTHYCQPSWPSFMYESDFREKVRCVVYLYL